MHDTADLEIRGIPTAFVATTEFVDAADAQSRSLGFEHTAVYVEHPIQDRTDAEMVDIADAAANELIASLVSDKGE